jgi:hypothetical protein
VLAEHLQDNDGEVLSHLLMARFTDWAVKAQDERSSDVALFVRILDRWFDEGDDYARNMLIVSFLEIIPKRSTLLDCLGPSLSEVASSM